jgi:folate-dependent phosphoribosylglycinamide formyltransferase PurN
MSFLYTNTESPLKVLFFFSGGASSMEAVLESENHGKIYEVIGAVSNRHQSLAEKGYGVAFEHGIDVDFVDAMKFKAGSEREAFYEKIAEAVENRSPDVIGLSGWLKRHSIISPGFFQTFQKPILNVHPADLGIIYNTLGGKHPIRIGTEQLRDMSRVDAGDDIYGKSGSRKNAWDLIRDNGFRRMLWGDYPVFTAALLGEEDTCSTIHVINEEVDAGPSLVQSKRMEIDTKKVEAWLSRHAYDRMADYAEDLQSQMKTECDGPAFCEALELIGSGRMEIFDDHAKLDGEIVRYGGYQMGE